MPTYNSTGDYPNWYWFGDTYTSSPDYNTATYNIPDTYATMIGKILLMLEMFDDEVICNFIKETYTDLIIRFLNKIDHFKDLLTNVAVEKL
jgi:hypothetical protein